MACFMDTNICIGYIFSWDPWHELSLKSFLKERNLYWSKTVKRESKNKQKKLLKKFRNFLMEIESDIRLFFKPNSLNKEDIKNITKKHFNNDKDFNKYLIAIDKIWEDFDLDQSVKKEKFCKVMQDTFFSISSIVADRRKKFEKITKLRSRGIDYPDIRNDLHENAKKCGVECHHPDEDIIIDAHHICVTIEPKLDFITSDKNICAYAEGITKLNNIIYLEDIDNFN